MWIYQKKLEYPVNIKTPNPKLASFIVSQYGGPDCNCLSVSSLPINYLAVLAFFCKLEFSMIKYSVLWAGTAIFWLSCLSCNIARIFRHVKGGLVRDRKIYPWTWRKICAK